MINLNSEIKTLKSKYQIDDEQRFDLALTSFLVGCDWFGEKPSIINGSVMVSEEFMKRHSGSLDEFARNFNQPASDKYELLMKKLADELPQTARFFGDFIKQMKMPSEISYILADFLLVNLPGELHMSSDKEIGVLISSAYDILPKVYGEALCELINWLNENPRIKTVYQNYYMMPNYYDSSENSQAYSEDYYLSIMYHFFNAEYIEENDMYARAAESKNYADTWLFISLHFLCALRTTDLMRFPHPILPSDPETILQQVKDGAFSEVDAKYTLYSITEYLASVRLTPNKTRSTSGVSAIKFHIPVSLETHIGTLFAIAESHFKLDKRDPAYPLIRPIRDYERISRYMGEEIGELFVESDFRTRSANKSFLQMIYLLTDNVLEGNDEFHVKGYMLAALARSHKGSYGEFAKTTSIYLKDAKMSGYSPEFVARELFERGVLSSVPSMLLQMITDGDYQKLSPENQTKLIKSLDMTPLEAENAVALMQKAIQQSSVMAEDIYQSKTDEQIMEILHRIGNGDAVSKMDTSLCLSTAMGKMCPYPDRSGCIGCKYEIGTKSTILLMSNELKRLQLLYQKSTNPFEKNKYKTLAVGTIAPKMADLLRCVKNEYGDEALKTLEEIIRKG